MDEDMDVNRVHFQREELKFDLTKTGEERPSSSAQLRNPTNRPVGFEVLATGLDNYVVKPSRGIVPHSGSRRIHVTARGLPPVEQREGKISVLTFDVPPDCREGDSVFAGKRDHLVISHCSEIRVRWVHPESVIHSLMNKAVEEVSHQNLGPALETLGEAIELRPYGYSLLSRALVNHFLGQNEEVKIDLQAAETLLSPSELDGGTGEHSNSSTAYGVISDMFNVPTYTTEKLYGKQMIVKWSEAITENRQLDVEVHFTPSVMQRSDDNVEVSVIVDSLRAKVVSSETTDSFPHHFLQSLKGEICPTGEWSKSFSEPGFGLFKCSPGNEHNPVSVQQGRSRGYVLGMALGASSTAVLQYNGNNTSGTTSHAYGLKKSTRHGEAYVFEYEVRKFEDGSSAQDLGNRRFYELPEIPKDIQDEVSYPKVDNYEGTWMVPKATAMILRNQFEFTISLEAKLPAVRRCRKSSLKHLAKPPKHELEVWQWKTRRICTFAIAGLKNFIRNSA